MNLLPTNMSDNAPEMTDKPADKTEIRFYHLQRKPLAQALPELLEKALQKKQPILVQLPSSDSGDMAEKISMMIWQDATRFIPHGTEKDGNPDHQPIWISDKTDNPNQAKILILVNGAWREDVDSFAAFDLCCFMLDGLDEAAVAQARDYWAAAKSAGYALSYWQQTMQGGWELKQKILPEEADISDAVAGN